MQHDKPTILAFVGESGVGKTTLFCALVDAEPGRFAVLRSSMTRSPRLHDPHESRVHRFLTLEEMEELRSRDAVWVPVNFPQGSHAWYAVQKADMTAIPEGVIGCIAFVQSVIEGYRAEGFTVYTVHVLPMNVDQLVDRGDPARTKADAMRAAVPFKYDFTIENDFSPGGLERTLGRLRALVAQLPSTS